ncbi:hypothetical protein DNTS_010118 [Danionella cerebrum]|uniref:Uncharacterized protein n=1 Tax=Danionella cerebrum TaxID=2873325 RepID=A0A553MM51_9TELE|nr:hypothetical protein DNTS_010118 [Danionella translucida]
MSRQSHSYWSNAAFSNPNQQRVNHHQCKRSSNCLWWSADRFRTGFIITDDPQNQPWTKEESLRQAAVANQFVPLNTNPKEVQEMRNKIREQNLQDKKTAGPQSQVLTGAVVDRSFVQRVTIWQGELVTASKAIIEKEYQPRVIVSKTGPNPFNKLTDEELEEYRREVELKQKGAEGKALIRDPTAAPVSEFEAQAQPQRVPDGEERPRVERETVVLPSAQVEESPQEPEETFAAPPSSLIPSRGTESGGASPAGPPESPREEFHTAVLKALGCEGDLPAVAPSAGSSEEMREDPSAREALGGVISNLQELMVAPLFLGSLGSLSSGADDLLSRHPRTLLILRDLHLLLSPGFSWGQLLEGEEGNVPSGTCTPPSSPTRVEEEAPPEQASREESDAATLRQTLPDLTSDEDSALPPEDPAPAQVDSAPLPEGEEPVAGDDAVGDHDDESLNKSPSKKKKKFRTPSFLKKNKKKSETQ